MKYVSSLLVSLSLLAVAFGIPIEPAVVSPRANEEYLLPTIVVPTNYNITLKPYLQDSDGEKQFTFDGNTYIQIQTEETNLRTIVMHSRNLKYTLLEYYATATPNTKLGLTQTSIDETTNKVTWTTANALQAGTSYTLHFVYQGTMDDDMHGFYKSYYIDDNNNKKWLGSTQFETNHARRAFPSFDEPKFKATFDVTIIRPKSFKTVSNTRIIRTEKVDDTYWLDVYATTPPMSTYLLAFLVSDFNERTDGDFSVVARPEYYSQTEYPFEIGRRLLVAFDEYTNLPYYTLGVDKMHMAAIPDFSAGAMENWGLLTYRERSLLYDNDTTTLSAKQSIAGVIAHEQAHMWFGDLVTCDWWSVTWLNEGFARYFQYYMTAVVHPEMELEKQFVVDQIQTVFTMDSTNNTNPMTDPNTYTPADLSRMFNSISYNKGGSVIRMIRHAIGEDNFKKSLQTYLDDKKYSTAVPQDIFDHWKANWPADTLTYADAFLKSFTEQVGYPVIYFDVAADSKSVTISQKRFLLKSGDGSDDSLLYTVPITYTTNLTSNFEATTPQFYLESSTASVTRTFTDTVSWVIGNIQESGYYRVNYNTAAWHKIHHALWSDKWSGIHELNRAQYVDDLLALSRSGDITYELSLDCLNYLETETNYLPWTSAFNGFSFIAIRLGTNNDDFGHYISQISKKAYQSLGFDERENDTPLEIYLRNKMIAWNCKYGESTCISKALEIFRKISTTPVPVNIRGAVYCTAMRDGTESDFNTLYNKLKTETIPTEQVLIINNLGCVRDTKLVERYFNIILSDEIRTQDKSSALSTLYVENAENVSPVFDLVTSKFEELAEAMGSYSAVATVISNIASRFTTEEQQKKLDDFIATNGNTFGTSVSTLNTAANTVKENLEWAKTRLGAITNYLTEFRTGGANALSVSMISMLLVTLVAFLVNA